MNFIIGVDNFGKIIQEKLSFIDKSLLIKELLDNSNIEATVITRPRRFGKTLNLSMLQHFFAKEVGGLKTKGMFDHLKIAKEGNAYMKHQGQYPVISISFKSMNSSGPSAPHDQIRTLIQKTYREHYYLLDSTKLYASDKKLYEAILNRDVTDVSVLESSLQELCRLVHLHHGVKPWLLIDEYDTPIQAGYTNSHYTEAVGLMRGILGGALKGNADIHRAVVTGILQISKENLFSGLNNLKVYSLLNEQYATHFGFTESEVDEALKKSDLNHLGTEIKAWYNGYHIGHQQIYNPWSIVNCVNENGMLIPYWVNTANSDLIKTSIALSDVVVKEKFEQILVGKPIKAIITEKMVFADVATNSDALWNLLFFSGYLTAIKAEVIDGDLTCLLQLPNREIATLYRTVIRGWFTASLSTEGYHAFLMHLITGELDRFSKKLKQFLQESSSFFDTKGKNPEKFYHGFVLGLIVSLADTHTIQSNKESGNGRYDVMIIPKDIQQLGLILEFKVAEENDTPLETAKKALVQIEARNYETELRQKGIQNILKVGLGFRGKEVELIYN